VVLLFQLLEDVLDVLAGLLDRRTALVVLTFGLLLVVAGHVAEAFFSFARKVFSGVLDLV
jgi:hypothetical protein